MTTPGQITVHVVKLPTCKTCDRPLRYVDSLTTGKCCHCRNDHSNHIYGCVVCWKPFYGPPPDTGRCDECLLIIAPLTNGGTP